MKDFFAGIVLYNPDISQLKKNIEAINEQVEGTVLVDNGSKNNNEILELLKQFNNIHLIQNSDNEGIAKALNQICEYTKASGKNWCLTLDQDSVCPEHMIENFANFCSESVGMVCPRLDIQGWNLAEETQIPAYERIKDCITSGALTSIKAWEKVGGFNEEYFIDLVDSEFSLKVINAGFEIIRVNSVLMQHEVGESIEKKIGTYTLHCTKHSPVRCYYMVRNHYLYIKQYKRQLNMKFERKMLFHKIVTSFLVADKKMYTAKMMFKGFRDYKKGRTGKIK